MSQKEYLKDIDGYEQIVQDIEVLKKYGTDYGAQKGRVKKIINTFHPRKLNLKVSEITRETPSAKSFKLVSTNDYLPPFQAGQYINLSVDTAGVRTSRPYSISSPPSRSGYYEIAIRRVADGFVSDYLLNDVQVGDVFESTSPGGYFYYNPLFHGKDLVFLAGGSGITPFMSMVREFTERGLDLNLHLIYGSVSPDDVIFHDELLQCARKHDNFRYDLVISDPPAGYPGHSGFLSAELLKKLIDDIPSKTCYICGPDIMHKFCCGQMDILGVPGRKVRTEISGPPKEVGQEPGWPIDVSVDDLFAVKVKGRTIQARAGEPLLNSLEREGIVLPAECRSGECSLCRTKLLAGKVFHPQGVKLRKSDRRFGYIHPCMAYPIEDLELML